MSRCFTNARNVEVVTPDTVYCFVQVKAVAGVAGIGADHNPSIAETYIAAPSVVTDCVGFKLGNVYVLTPLAEMTLILVPPTATAVAVPFGYTTSVASTMLPMAEPLAFFMELSKVTLPGVQGFTFLDDL